MELDLSDDSVQDKLSKIDQMYRTLYNGSATGTKGGLVYAVQTTLPELIASNQANTDARIESVDRRLSILIDSLREHRIKSIAYWSGASTAGWFMYEGLRWVVLHFDMLGKLATLIK